MRENPLGVIGAYKAPVHTEYPPPDSVGPGLPLLRDADNHRQRSFRTDYCACDVEAAFRHQLVQVVAGDATRKFWKVIADRSARLVASIRDHFPKLPRRVSGYNLDERSEEHTSELQSHLNL